MSFFSGVAEFFSDLNNWVFGVLIGVMGKISYELYMKRTISVFQWVAVIGLSIFSGYLTSVYCDNAGLEKEASWAVPVATLMGEKVFIYVMANYKKIISGVLSFFMPKK
jgi:hypothetical protein